MKTRPHIPTILTRIAMALAVLSIDLVFAQLGSAASFVTNSPLITARRSHTATLRRSTQDTKKALLLQCPRLLLRCSSTAWRRRSESNPQMTNSATIVGSRISRARADSTRIPKPGPLAHFPVIAPPTLRHCLEPMAGIGPDFPQLRLNSV